MLSTIEAQFRASKGMIFLARRTQVDHWLDLVDLDMLNMGDAQSCVLGMIYGSIGVAVITLRNEAHSDGRHFSAHTLEDCGFYLPPTGSRNYSSLTTAWRCYLHTAQLELRSEPATCTSCPLVSLAIPRPSAYRGRALGALASAAHRR